MVSLSMPLSDPWPEFQESRGFVNDSWAFLFRASAAADHHYLCTPALISVPGVDTATEAGEAASRSRQRSSCDDRLEQTRHVGGRCQGQGAGRAQGRNGNIARETPRQDWRGREELFFNTQHVVIVCHIECFPCNTQCCQGLEMTMREIYHFHSISIFSPLACFPLPRLPLFPPLLFPSPPLPIPCPPPLPIPCPPFLPLL